jgi:mRNA interferase MazF
MASVDELWLVDFGEPYPAKPALRRPTLVIGPPDIFGPEFPFVIVTPLTTTRRTLSLHVEVEATASTGLDETSYIQCELIRAINGDRLVHRLGAIDSDVSHRVATMIKTLLNY